MAGGDKSAVAGYIPEQYRNDPLGLAKACATHMYASDLASKKLGIEMSEVTADGAVMTMRVRDDMVNGHKICHGGFIFTLADSTFAFTCNSKNQVAVASDCLIDFIRPVKLNDVLTARGHISQAGRTTGLCAILVVNQDDKKVALFRGRYHHLDQAILPADGNQA